MVMFKNVVLLTSGFVELLTSYYFMMSFLKRHQSSKWSQMAALLGIAFVGRFVDSTIPTDSTFRMLINLGLSLMIMMWLFRDKWYKVTFFFLLSIIFIMMIPEMLILGCVVLATGVNIDIIVSNPSLLMISVVSTRLLSILLVTLMRRVKLYPHRMNMKSWSELLIILMMNIVVTVVVLCFVFSNTNQLMTYLSFGLLISISYVCIRASMYIVRYANDAYEWSLKEQEHLRVRVYFERMNAISDELKAQRHDFNNHLNCLHGFLMMDDYQSAHQYTEKLVEDTSNFNEIIQIKNPTVASMINTKQRMAKLKGIRMDFNIQLPSEMAIHPTDLCIVLGNLLDNALEATEKMRTIWDQGDGEIQLPDPSVRVKMSLADDFLLCHIINPFANQIPREPTGQRTLLINPGFTSKEDAANHGFGLENVRYVIGKYDGEFEQWQENQVFHAKFAMRNMVLRENNKHAS